MDGKCTSCCVRLGRLSEIGEPMSVNPQETALTGGDITVDLGALVENYNHLKSRAAPADLAAVVKADAYGLGAPVVVRALLGAGCRRFFVAHLDEGLAVRGVTSDAEIYVLNGLWEGAEATAVQGNIVPVLNSLEQLLRWRKAAQGLGRKLPAVLQIDTGMARLGLPAEEVAQVVADPALLDAFDLHYVMSHFACADDQASPVTSDQALAFEALVNSLPPAPRSIANSAAGLSQTHRPGDLVRAGLALYGGAPFSDGSNPMRPVLKVRARVVQIRRVQAGAGVGYGHTYHAETPRQIATIAVGYADGWPRNLSNRGAAYLGDKRLPIVGQVSMDSMMVDVSALEPGELQGGDYVELIGPQQSIEDVAALSGTISYEILTNLSRRFSRRYVHAELSK